MKKRLELKNQLESVPNLEARGAEASPSNEFYNGISPLSLDELSSCVAALDVHHHQAQEESKENPKDLSHLVGKGFSFQSFTKLLQDEDIFKLDSHFKWMLELVQENGLLDEKRIISLKQKMMSWVSESDEHLSVFQTVAQKLMLAVYSGFLSGETEEVRQYFAEVTETLKNALEDPEDSSIEHEQLQVYRYIKLTDEQLISNCTEVLAKNYSITSKHVAIKNLKKNVAVLVIEDKNVFRDKASQACFFGMKGFLANQLGMAAVTVELFQQAVHLNPNCYDWLHHLYTALRRHRRESEFGKAPSEMEYTTCQQANKLRPNYWVSLLALANLYEDTNKTKFPRITKEERSRNERKIIDTLEEARRLAPNNVTVNLKLAGAYSEVDLSPEVRSRCEKLLRFCELTWPNNSQVFHKIGKFYNRPDNRNFDRSVPDGKAEYYFEKALQVDSLNFPCLMDFLRLKMPMLSMEDSVKLVDKYLPEYKYKKIFYGKLAIKKGYLQWWLNEKSDAVRSWLDVFDSVDRTEDVEVLSGFLAKTLYGNNDILSNAFGQKSVDFEEAKSKLSELALNLLDSVDDRSMNLLTTALNSPRPSKYVNRTRTTSTNSSMDGERDGKWREQRTNNSKEPPPSGTSIQPNTRNGNVAGDNIGRGRFYQAGTQQRRVPFGETVHPRYNEQRVPTTTSTEDSNWRQRDRTSNRVDHRNVVLTSTEDLHISINAREFRQQSTNGFGNTRNDDHRYVTVSGISDDIPLDENGRWEQVNLDEDLNRRGYRMDSSSGRNNNGGRRSRDVHNLNWR